METAENSDNLISLYRVVDVNINRLKEGVRVCEDLNRFVFNNFEIAKDLKTVRHLATLKNYSKFLKLRDIQNDILKKTLKSENSRDSIFDIFTANIKRSQESARVLEEIFKLIEKDESEKFKSIRYSLYNIELKFTNFLI